MAVILIVEDGTNVADANTFADVTFARAYAANRGIVLPDDDDVLAMNLFNAADFLNTLEDRFAGYRAEVGQAMIFPRYGVPYPKPGYVYSADEIPPPLLAAQVELAVAIQAGVDLYTGVGGAGASAANTVKRRKIGPLETEYQDNTRVSAYDALALSNTLAAVSPRAYQLLSPLFGANGGINIMSVRK